MSAVPPAADADPDPDPDPDDRVDAYQYELDPVRIAAEPSASRDGSRLLVHERSTGRTHHARFRELPDFLAPEDLLVLNDTQVLPARLVARRASGAKVEVLLHPTGDLPDAARPSSDWREAVELPAMLRPSARIRRGERLALHDDLHLELLDEPGASMRRVRLSAPLEAVLERGSLPLPPYLLRQRPSAGLEELDRERYQTVYARNPGSIAAPTAGLHFTEELLARLDERGLRRTTLTLHVGPGTFLPVRTERLSEHAMHQESFDVPPHVRDAVLAARRAGGRVVAVGTTTTRALEAATDEGSRSPRAGAASTKLLIRPPYRFRTVDALITNFHLPGSTLLALVAALVGRERLLALYQEAQVQGYRFYSYGDAMLVL